MISSGMHDPILIAAMLTSLVPFVAFVVIMIFTRAYPRISAALSIAAVAISLLCALFLLATRWEIAIAPPVYLPLGRLR